MGGSTQDLHEENAELRNKYSELRRNYTTLQSNYDEMVKRLSALEAQAVHSDHPTSKLNDVNDTTHDSDSDPSK